jgi:hypothetical protein
MPDRVFPAGNLPAQSLTLSFATMSNGSQPAQTPLWSAVDRLIGRVLASGAGIEGLHSHKLGPLAAQWLERSGRPVPDELREEQRSASLATMIATPLVRRIRETVEGELILLKGPELAALYPAGGRRFSDVDVLSDAATAAQDALLGAGFVEVDDESYSRLEDHHHLHPIRFPAIWLNVEVHSAPNWPLSTPKPPPLKEIFRDAVPSALGIAGVSAPSRPHHALILAAHGWRHEPFARLRDLLDIAVLVEGLPPAQLQATADRWGIGRLWATTQQAIDAIFFGARPPLALKVLGAHLETARERTVFENHLAHWLYPYWELPLQRALKQTAQTARTDLAPAAGETWRQKLGRMLSAVWHPRSSAAARR